MTDEQMKQYGKNLARILKLKRDTENKDRWQTEFGSKTDLGLYLTMKRLVLSAEEGSPDSELLS